MMQLPPLSLYIHLPWCERKCPYCDFNSHETSNIPETAYVAALLADLRQDLPYLQGRSVETLFIGGGTPSLFSADAIAQLLEGIASLLRLSPGLEATMEANPGSAEADKFLGFRQAGITRLSLGIQSFNNDKLRTLGRVHDADQALAAIEFTRAAGFDSFNIDLMHGLPGQSVEQAAIDLETAIACTPPHLSWYQLTIEPNTVYHKRPPSLPAEDALADIQQQGEQLLARSGYGQYEVSAYSQAGFQCRHNRNYWSFGDYLAIGAGAHGKVSFADGRILRYAKTRAPADYLAAAPDKRTASTRLLKPGEVVGEFMLNALRLNDGFSTDTFEERTGLTAPALEPQLQRMVDRELLLNDAAGIRATGLGGRFLDSVVTEFFEDRG
jgi:oxygen-independent coproporphyrinogen-3 oxidase